MFNGRKYLEKSEHPHPHIGNLVRNIMTEKRISKAEVARKLNVTPSVVNEYLKNPSLQFGILWKLCIALNYDFLSELKKYYPPSLPTPEQEKIADLEKEIAIYKSALKIN